MPERGRQSQSQAQAKTSEENFLKSDGRPLPEYLRPRGPLTPDMIENIYEGAVNLRAKALSLAAERNHNMSLVETVENMSRIDTYEARADGIEWALQELLGRESMTQGGFPNMRARRDAILREAMRRGKPI